MEYFYVILNLDINTAVVGSFISANVDKNREIFTPAQ